MRVLQELEQRVHALHEVIRASSFLVLSEGEALVKTVTGLKIYVDPRDTSVGIHIALDNAWEELTTRAWLSLVRPDSVVLDIGANFGYFGAVAGQKTDPKKGKVVLFEANPKLLPYLDKTLSINWLREQCIVEGLAVSDRNGTVELNLLKEHLGSSSLHPLEHLAGYMGHRMNLASEESVVVESTTIDDYCEQHHVSRVDLIKMDIEGYEEKAYRGMKHTVLASPDVSLFVEFTWQSYENARGFYEEMLCDFGSVYLVGDRGQLVRPASVAYDDVVGTLDDWIMLVFSKDARLAEMPAGVSV